MNIENLWFWRCLRLFIVCVGFSGIFVACSSSKVSGNDAFLPSVSDIDRRLDSATIEDYILALPANYCTELEMETFAEKLKALRETSGDNGDRLVVPGDGTFPKCEFRLDRKTKSLSITHLSGADLPYSETLRRVQSGWVRVYVKRN